MAVLLTPPGAAAIAVLRLSGPGVEPFLAKYFSQPTPIGRCVHGLLRDESGEVLDDPVVVRSGNDGIIADINLHGGSWVARSVLNLTERSGFEFRHAAQVPTVAHDAANELEREVLEGLPRARTELALRILLAQPAAWAELEKRSGQAELREMLADRSLVNLLHLPRVAIVGAPNVGKSTLANQLFGQERSITTDVPGTTRDWVGEIANIDGLTVMLVDTPGVRETPDAIEREAIERSGLEVGRANLIVLVFDASRPILPQERSLVLAHPDALKVLNKAELSRGTVEEGNVIETVATTGRGITQLRDAIRRHFGCLDVSISKPKIWTERQRLLITRLLEDLD